MDTRDFQGDRAAEMAKNYHDLKSRLDKGLGEAAKTSDPRAAKKILIDLQSHFKGLLLQHDEREELYGRLQDAFTMINRRIDEAQAAFEAEAYVNYRELKIIVDDVIARSEKSENWKTAKGYLIDAQQSFRDRRMVSGQREELYSRLQSAFQTVRERQSLEIQSQERDSEDSYKAFLPKVDELLSAVRSGNDIPGIKDRLIALQNELRDAGIHGEKRNDLLNKLQEGFDLLRNKREEGAEKIRQQSELLFPLLTKESDEVLLAAQKSSDFRGTRDKLRELQSSLRDSLLLREQKDFLYERLQEAFTVLNQRQDEDHLAFEEEALSNYKRLGKLVEEGLLQAQESHEYKETREYLKKIQSEFKGIRMLHEQREELYSRLQTAFETLQQRIDIFFREKQKNWEVRMNFKVKDLAVTAEQLQQEIGKDLETVEELENHLDIINQRPQDTGVRFSLLARIDSVKGNLARKRSELERTLTEMESLQKRLDGD